CVFLSLLIGGAVACDGGRAALLPSPPPPSGPTASPAPPTPVPPVVRDGLRITGLERYSSFVVAEDFIDIGAELLVNGVPRDCTNTAKWTVADSRIATISLLPNVRLKGHRGTTDITAECEGKLGTATVTFDYFDVVGTVLDGGKPVVGARVLISDDLTLYGSGGGATDARGEFGLRRMSKKVVRLRIVKSAYDWKDVSIEWDAQPIMTVAFQLERIGTSLLDEEFRTIPDLKLPYNAADKDYDILVTAHGMLRVDTFYSSGGTFGGGSLLGQLFSGEHLVATGHHGESTDPILQARRLFEVDLSPGVYRLKLGGLWGRNTVWVGVTDLSQRVGAPGIH